MLYQFLRFPGGKPKAVTLSYDDGNVADIKLIEIINKYGIKCTFNLLGSLVKDESRLTVDYIKKEILGGGHEVANHGYDHRSQLKIRPIEGIRELLDCRLTLEKTLGTIIKGFAYPDTSVKSTTDPELYKRIKSVLTEVDIAYARCADEDNNKFLLPDDFHRWMPTAHHDNPDILEYIDEFVSMDVSQFYWANKMPRLFYLWGHASEFDNNDNWDHFEDICQRLGGKDDIWYATNIEIYNYVKAYESLSYSADGTMIYNPTVYTIWFDVDGRLYSVEPGETLSL